jgi:hypothetical protein
MVVDGLKSRIIFAGYNNSPLTGTAVAASLILAVCISSNNLKPKSIRR